MEEKIFSVSEYINILNNKLRTFHAKVIGEVSDVNFGPTGHVYFFLKDEKDESIIKCVIWKRKYDIYGVEIKDGLKIISYGAPKVHVKYGFSFIAETIEVAGEGMLKKEYERLKNKLTDEGAFEKSRKRALPKYPQKIGIITSRQGAVLADFLSNIGKHGFKIQMIDSRVEGQTAVFDLLSAVKTFREKDIEALVIMRGGGSLESLQAFNNESLVREVINFPVPVIAAIGHDKDVPLVSLAADMSLSTPSIAASILSESWQRAVMFLEKYEIKIIGDYLKAIKDYCNSIERATEAVRNYYDSIFSKHREIKNNLRVAFNDFQKALSNVKIDLEDLVKKSSSGFSALLLRSYKHLERAERNIGWYNPERQLGLGYSIARAGNKIIRSVGDVKIGEDVDLTVVDGTIVSKIKNINNKKT